MHRLPCNTERPVREQGDEPRSNSVMRKRCVLYPARFERGECFELSARAMSQSHGPVCQSTGRRKSVVRGPLNTERGFSLIELMAAIAISAIVLGAITATFISQSRSFVTQEQINGMQQAARAAMDMITREVRMAGYDPTGNGFSGIHYHSNQIHIRADLGGDNPVDPPDGNPNDANENIYYSYDPVQRLIERDDRDGSGMETLVENIEGPGGASGFTFVYLDGAGATISSGSGEANIRQVQLTITARAAKSDPNYPLNDGFRTYTLTSLITPRNLGY